MPAGQPCRAGNVNHVVRAPRPRLLAAGRGRAGHLLRLRGQERAVPAARLVARRHGRAHAGQRPDPRRHDGGRRRLSGGPLLSLFTPEVLTVIAYIGCITLFIAATIALTATDIKRVLAYSTVSQLGYMMLALGVGGWLAGLFHLFTHAFFKALLFLCSGSVIHACGHQRNAADGRPAEENALDRRHHARRLPGDRRGGRAVADRPERLSTPRTASSPRRSRSPTQSAARLAFLGGGGRGGDDRLLHVPPLVPDLCRPARATSTSTSTPTSRPGPWSGRWWCWPCWRCLPAGTSYGRTSAWSRCWSRPVRRAWPTGPRPAGRRRWWSSPPNTSATAGDRASGHVLGLRLRPGRLPLGHGIYGRRTIIGRMAPPALPAHVQLPHPQVVV